MPRRMSGQWRRVVALGGAIGLLLSLCVEALQAPANVTAMATSPSRVIVSWTDSEPGVSDAFTVLYREQGSVSDFQRIELTETFSQYEVTGLTESTTYTFQVNIIR
jgi:hypothetical protein